MKRIARILVLAIAVVCAGCATIPAEAPELSAQLGGRISALEVAHVRAVEKFFAERRSRVDEFIQETWVPTFAKEFFEDKDIDDMWKQVVASKDPNDRLQFIVIIGPRLQKKINEKRLELMKPLEELEREVKSKLKIEYDQARSINNALTAFLQSASKVEDNRKRYLEMVGIADMQVDKFIDETDEAVSQLVSKAKSASSAVDKGKDYLNKIKAITQKVKS